MRNKKNTCCFTGHRDISAMSYQMLVNKLEPIVMKLIECGYKYFACGGALGFDTFAAMYICSLKKRGYDVKLLLILPCKDQTAKWSSYDKQVYNDIFERADEVIYTAESYFPGCMQKRNRALVDASSVCVCYLYTAGNSGTRQTVDYARDKGLILVNVADF